MAVVVMLLANEVKWTYFQGKLIELLSRWLLLNRRIFTLKSSPQFWDVLDSRETIFCRKYCLPFQNGSKLLLLKWIPDDLTLLISSPEPKALWWAYHMARLLSVCVYVVCSHFQTSPLEPLGRLRSNFMWSVHGMGERKFAYGVQVTWPGWPPCPYMVKTLQKSSSEPLGQFAWNLVCSIWDVGPS